MAQEETSLADEAHPDMSVELRSVIQNADFREAVIAYNRGDTLDDVFKRKPDLAKSAQLLKEARKLIASKINGQ